MADRTKKEVIETLKKAKPFLERESFDYARKELQKKYEHPALTAVKEASEIVTNKYKAKAKNIMGGMKVVYDKLRPSNDKKFKGYTDNR